MEEIKFKILQNIRFIQQVDNGCMPASINIVLDYYMKGIILNQELWKTKLRNSGNDNLESMSNLFKNENDFNK